MRRTKKITGIYKITNKINDTSYIGLSQHIIFRWWQHRTNYKNEKNASYNSHLYRAMRMYGIKNFTWTILEECDKHLLDEREIYWVYKYDTFKNGYNMTTGGNYETERSEVTKQKISNSKKVPIYCVELNKYFDSSKDAAEALNFKTPQRISQAAHHKNRQTAAGYRWVFAHDFNTMEELELILSDRKIQIRQTELNRRAKIQSDWDKKRNVH